MRFIDRTDDQEFWNERAAIYEYEGKHARVKAEEFALRDLIAEKKNKNRDIIRTL